MSSWFHDRMGDDGLISPKMADGGWFHRTMIFDADGAPAVALDWQPAFPGAVRRADEVVASGPVQGRA